MVTMDDVVQVLGAHEPDYRRAAALGADAFPLLQELFQGQDLGLAAKAVSLAPLIDAGRAVPLLTEAARSGSDVLRVAAAAATQNLPEQEAADLQLQLMDDEDAGVRQVAARRAAQSSVSSVRARAEALQADPGGG